MTTMNHKTIDTLTEDDLKKHPVWKFKGGRDQFVEPVAKLPCKTLVGRVVGAKVSLADATTFWALIGNVCPERPEFSTHFLTLSLLNHGAWFHLARYHDFDYSERGPMQLAAFLGKSPKDVFPISYDLRTVYVGESASLQGVVEMEPSERLTREEIIAMAVP